jgi:putative hemolysin
LDSREVKIERIKKGMQLLFERGYFEPSDIGVGVNAFEWYCYQSGGVFVKVKRFRGYRIMCVSSAALHVVKA